MRKICCENMFCTLMIFLAIIIICPGASILLTIILGWIADAIKSTNYCSLHSFNFLLCTTRGAISFGYVLLSAFAICLPLLIIDISLHKLQLLLLDKSYMYYLIMIINISIMIGWGFLSPFVGTVWNITGNEILCTGNYYYEFFIECGLYGDLIIFITTLISLIIAAIIWGICDIFNCMCRKKIILFKLNQIIQ